MIQVSLRILDSMAFHTEGTTGEWVDSARREWLSLPMVIRMRSIWAFVL